MSKWNGKLKCIRDYLCIDETLTKDKEYLVSNGVFYYDNGFSSCIYKNYTDFINRNPNMSKFLIEIPLETTKEPDWQIEQSKLAKYIMINETVTIAIPINTPIGISFRHPDDEYDEELGQTLALKRLYEHAVK